MWENSYISHSGVNWEELHNCSNSWITQWSISVISCQSSAVWDCSSRDECFRKWGAWFKCQYYFLKDKCSLPTSVLLFTIWCVRAFILVPGWESVQFFTAQPLLVGHILYAHSAMTVKWWQCLSLYFLCKAEGFTSISRYLPRVTVLLQPVTAHDEPYWMCVAECVYVGGGNRKMI